MKVAAGWLPLPLLTWWMENVERTLVEVGCAAALCSTRLCTVCGTLGWHSAVLYGIRASRESWQFSSLASADT